MLDRELALWRATGLSLPLWWRDDDAVEPTAALDQLSEISADVGIPVHLAVIPAHATEGLAARMDPDAQLIPVVHGWAHANHAPVSEKKAEFRAHRPLNEMVEEAGRGFARLQELFGASLQPMFVPPWNRIDKAVVAKMPALGFRVLSTATPRKTTLAAAGMWEINTHLDPIDWRGTRSLRPPEQLVALLVQHLQDRRKGHADNTEPYGLLTHHLVHDEDIWRFSHEVLLRLMDGPTRVWTMAETLQEDPT
ncbi:polysaccharide deacetylase family protein [Falsiruegeria litorea]|uniref:polysaccharide deacetylase family protein n=1 Tax=Falsiruegeria litorea TaxID=1280831 RepID=UPI001F33C3C3|nr:polysaccharide deacetylase family protein [Falsiruegeria litorea]